MSRAQFQVLVIPYRFAKNDVIEYALMKRSDLAVRQFISGGGENEETPLETAKREANEEAGIPYDFDYIQLHSTASIYIQQHQYLQIIFRHMRSGAKMFMLSPNTRLVF